MKYASSTLIAICAILAAVPGLSSLQHERLLDNHHADTSPARLDTTTVRALLDSCARLKDSNPRRALVLAEQALAGAKEHGAARLTARAHLLVGQLLLNGPSRMQADGHFRAAFEIGERINDVKVMGDVYTGLATISALSGRMDDALRQLADARRSYERGGVKAGVAQVLFVTASRVHQQRGDFAEAMEAYRRCLALFEELQDRAGSAGVLINIGAIHLRQGRSIDAVHHLHMGLRISEAIGHATWSRNAFQNLTSAYLALGRLDSASLCLERTVALNEALGDKAGLATAHILKANMYSRQNKSKEALDTYAEAARLAKEAADVKAHALALANGAVIHGHQGRHDLCVRQSEEAIQLYESIGDSIGMLVPLNSIAVMQQQTGEIHAARTSLLRNLRIAERLGLTREIANYSSTLGQVYRTLGNNDSAMICYKRSMAIYEKSQNIGGIADVANSMALVHKDGGNTTAAIEMFELSLRSAEQQGNRRGAAYTMHNLASLLAKSGRLDAARDLRRTAYATLEALGDKRGMAATLHGLGDVYAQRGDIDSAYASYLQSVRLSDEIGDKVSTARTLNNMTRLQSDPARFHEVYDILRRNLSFFDERGERHLASDTRVLLGAIALARGNLDEAQVFFEDVLRTGNDMKQPSIIGDAVLGLSRVFSARRDFAKALEHHMEYARIRDTLLAETNLRSINELKAKYESEKQTQRIALLEKDNALRGAELEKRGRDLRVQQLEAERNRQLARILAGEHDRRLLELNVRTTQLELQAQTLRREQTEKVHLKRHSAQQAAISSREAGLRNALLACIVLFFIAGFLGLKRVQSRRREALLRAEAAEYQARALEAASERREKEHQKLFARGLIDSQEQERKRIAHDLHDGLGQNLMIIKNQLYYLTRYEHLSDDIVRRIGEVAGVTTTAIEEVRQLSYNLRPILIERTGLSRTLVDTVGRTAEASGLNITHEIEAVDTSFTMDEQINIYRIVQEALSNVLKYAAAARVHVEMRLEDGAVRLMIRDDGRGFDMKADRALHGLGLQSMRERAEILGGTIRIWSAAGEGTRIEVHIPRGGALEAGA